MSDKPIAVGDLVIVVRWPCCGRRTGIPFTVEMIDCGCDWRCVVCRKDHPHEPLAIGSGASAPFSWLKRIDPPAESETREAYINLPTKQRTPA